MKKSNYLHYLKELQTKKGIEVSKTFKNGKKHSTSHNSRNSNPKTKEHRILQKDGDVFEALKMQDKQNEHPNMIKMNKRQLNPTQKPSLPQNIIEGLNHKSSTYAQFNKINQSSKQHKIAQKQFGISLSRCNFEPSHNSSNLFLVETLTNGQLIVCEQCSSKFSKRTPLNSFNSKKPKHSYGSLVNMLQQLEQKHRKLGRVMLMQKQTIGKTIDQVSSYYSELIRVIIQKKNQLQHELVEAYNNNEQTIKSCINKNTEHITLVNRVLEKWEKTCAKGQTYHQTKEENFSEQIDQLIEELSQNHSIQLSCITQQIPMHILNRFYNDFTQSPYCITLSRQQGNLDNSKSGSLDPHIDPILQQQQETYPENQEEHQNPIKSEQENQAAMIQYQNKMDLSPDYEKQIPFNVEYSLTSQNPANFSHKIDDHLSRISSSEELLIDSLRNSDSYPRLNNNLSAPLINGSKQHQEQINGLQNPSSKYEKYQPEKELNNLAKGVNFRTESSTCRTLPPQNSYGKLNFIKQIHVDQDDFTDLICDEDLTLSSSHPIHENPVPARKSLKLSYNPYKRHEHPLTLEQLNSELSQPQKIPEIFNPSIISANQNKHEISFELDENMLIDANILPTEDIDQENLDIISPAFKII